ncbi:MAG: T9SS type A sorting domain-containing protein [Saprospiraceae bacterium]|nr:T9SS type A sorting domain-containing protein [Saprospiraceae bacterium]
MIAIAILNPNNLFAQKEGFYKELKERKHFVFQGEIVKSTGKWNAGKSVIYTEHEVRLTKVFKGDLTENQVRLITLGGETDSDFVIAGKALQLSEGSTGIFFAQVKPHGMLSEIVFKGKTCFADDPNGFVMQHVNDRGSTPLGFGAMYQKEKYDKVLAELGHVLFEYPEVTEHNLFPAIGCDDPAYQTSAEITFENISVTGNFANVELDIMIKGMPQGVKFGKCEFFLTFPTGTFGQNLVQNNLINVSKGDVAQGTSYALTVFDEAANKVKITVSLSSGSLVSPYALSGSVEQLLHCTFSVVNLSGLPNLKASDFALTGNVWYECDRSLLPFREIIIKTEGDVITPNFENLIGINYRMQRFLFKNSGGVPRIEMDIYASSTEPTIYNKGKLYIDYSNIAIGSNIVSNLDITLLNNTDYFINSFDEDANTLRIEIDKGPLSTDVVLDQEFKRLFTLRILISDCAENADIEWNPLTNNSENNYLEAGTVFQYVPVLFDGGLATPMCGCNLPDDPVITGFADVEGNPIVQVRAGTGEILKIIGDNFGDVIVDGSCFVEVRDGDGPESMKTKIPLVDIIDWKNTAITFFVPSTTVGKVNGPMASGPVKVFNACGESNKEDIDVHYAVMNYRPSISEKAYRLALERQTNNGIVFKFSSNVGGDERDLTTHAIETWCNATGIHWSHGETLQNYTTQSPTDGINLVVEVPSSQLPSADAAAIVAGNTTPSYQNVCNNDKTYYVQNIDIVIDQSSNFDPFDASDQRIFLHEFGHAHMLNHAAKLFGAPGSQKLIYYTYDASGAITSADLEGANTVFPASAALLTGGGCPDPIDTHPCTNATSESGLAGGIKISPIPFTDNLVIESELPLLKDATVALYGMTGGKILQRSFGEQATIRLNGLGMLPNGIYFLVLSSDGQSLSRKLIKTKGHE